ncbi:T9SS C-terminal target domain-containing protein [Neptunitalea chrysea]|uniref:T9SS C-terminal target domain-containing protein n=1 Tax=Neptunitalea chrysea TaxID=1647581 RepID=A0A9W6B7L4_9FLAO|nr:T9SS type A sorting domain-containing protein [Neptunitalea chrysea]GLB52213.1 T9SS C-terminal target domain-containing protein [Neptunitalea chrysea]
MKKTLLLLFIGCFTWAVNAQSKSTGTVALGSSMSAEIELDNGTSTATLTLTGPSDRWIALQFGSFSSGQGMASGQDVVYYNGSTLVDARMNGIGSTPTTDTNNWTVTSNTVSSSVRTIVATRSFNTGDANDFTFSYSDSSLDFAYAYGGSSSYSLAYHGSRGYSLNASFTLGLEEFQAASIKVYPNPAAKSFSVESAIPINEVKMYDVNGKLVMVKKSDVLSNVDISSLDRGVYFLELASDLGTLYRKLIKE